MEEKKHCCKLCGYQTDYKIALIQHNKKHKKRIDKEKTKKIIKEPEEKLEDMEKELPVDKPVLAKEKERVIKKVEGMNVREVLGKLATSSDVMSDFNKMVTDGQVANPRATEIELKRRGFNLKNL